MKNGLFRAPRLVLIIAFFTLSSCASLLDQLTESNDLAELDRGYVAEATSRETPCEGIFCRSSGAAAEGAGRSPASLSPEERAVRRAIDARDVVLGMTRQDVTSSWGEPMQREVAGRGSHGNERWTYGSKYSLNGVRTVVFENGRVAGWHR